MRRRVGKLGEPLAIEATALAFFMESPVTPNVVRDGIAIVNVRGPLEHHASMFCDSYEGLRSRVAEALANAPKAVVLALDSPGGVLSGCFEAASDVGDLCKAAGVPLHAYVDGKATSAAYALACVAESITVPTTGIVGSIGTIVEMIDTSAADAAMGVRVQVVASGERKGDLNPHQPLTDSAVSAVRGHVDGMAETFFAHVALHRPIEVDAIRALQAGLVVGVDAMRLGLADAVGTLPELITRLSAPTPTATATTPAPAGASSEDSMSDYEKARAALKAVVEDKTTDEKAKARASAALKAMDESEEDKPKAEDEGPPPSDNDDKKKPEPDAKAIAMETRAMVLSDRRDRDVAALLATRADLSDEQRTAFSALEPTALKAVLAATPRKPLNKAAATAVVPATRGATSGERAYRQDPKAAAALRVAMGLDKPEFETRVEGDSLVLGAMKVGA